MLRGLIKFVVVGDMRLPVVNMAFHKGTSSTKVKAPNCCGLQCNINNPLKVFVPRTTFCLPLEYTRIISGETGTVVKVKPSHYRPGQALRVSAV